MHLLGGGIDGYSRIDTGASATRQSQAEHDRNAQNAEPGLFHRQVSDFGMRNRERPVLPITCWMLTLFVLSKSGAR